jgi:hypothetical protein
MTNFGLEKKNNFRVDLKSKFFSVGLHLEMKIGLIDRKVAAVKADGF